MMAGFTYIPRNLVRLRHVSTPLFKARSFAALPHRGKAPLPIVAQTTLPTLPTAIGGGPRYLHTSLPLLNKQPTLLQRLNLLNDNTTALVISSDIIEISSFEEMMANIAKLSINFLEPAAALILSQLGTKNLELLSCNLANLRTGHYKIKDKDNKLWQMSGHRIFKELQPQSHPSELIRLELKIFEELLTRDISKTLRESVVKEILKDKDLQRVITLTPIDLTGLNPEQAMTVLFYKVMTGDAKPTEHCISQALSISKERPSVDMHRLADPIPTFVENINNYVLSPLTFPALSEETRSELNAVFLVVMDTLLNKKMNVDQLFPLFPVFQYLRAPRHADLFYIIADGAPNHILDKMELMLFCAFRDKGNEKWEELRSVALRTVTQHEKVSPVYEALLKQEQITPSTIRAALTQKSPGYFMDRRELVILLKGLIAIGKQINFNSFFEA